MTRDAARATLRRLSTLHADPECVLNYATEDGAPTTFGTFKRPEPRTGGTHAQVLTVADIQAAIAVAEKEMQP